MTDTQPLQQLKLLAQYLSKIRCLCFGSLPYNFLKYKNINKTHFCEINTFPMNAFSYEYKIKQPLARGKLGKLEEK
jgi:hypothetical protein